MITTWWIATCAQTHTASFIRSGLCTCRTVTRRTRSMISTSRFARSYDRTDKKLKYGSREIEKEGSENGRTGEQEKGREEEGGIERARNEEALQLRTAANEITGCECVSTFHILATDTLSGHPPHGSPFAQDLRFIFAPVYPTILQSSGQLTLHEYLLNVQVLCPENLPKRSEYQVPEDAFVFCNFCRLGRITEELFHVWLRILQVHLCPWADFSYMPVRLYLCLSFSRLPMSPDVQQTDGPGGSFLLCALGGVPSAEGASQYPLALQASTSGHVSTAGGSSCRGPGIGQPSCLRAPLQPKGTRTQQQNTMARTTLAPSFYPALTSSCTISCFASDSPAHPLLRHRCTSSSLHLFLFLNLSPECVDFSFCTSARI